MLNELILKLIDEKWLKKITMQWLWQLSQMNEVEIRIIEIKEKRMKTSDAITMKDLLTMRRIVG